MKEIAAQTKIPRRWLLLCPLLAAVFTVNAAAEIAGATAVHRYSGAGICLLCASAMVIFACEVLIGLLRENTERPVTWEWALLTNASQRLHGLLDETADTIR